MDGTQIGSEAVYRFTFERAVTVLIRRSSPIHDLLPPEEGALEEGGVPEDLAYHHLPLPLVVLHLLDQVIAGDVL